MIRKVRWGVVGVAKIAVEKVIPAMQRGAHSEVVAIASRDLAKAQSAASELGLAMAYGSYDEMLRDPGIDAIYNPLPNHLHVPVSTAAAEAGKHVLCEKPLGLNADEARDLIAARDRAGVKIGEAFMVKTHPQWLRAQEIVRSGEIGDLRAVMGAFSYFNNDPANIRNKPEWGGGALFDIGCYTIIASRMLFGEEPKRVCGLVERDPALGIDRLSSALLDFPSGQAVFTVSTQFVPYQRVQAFGTKGRVEIEIPFNAPPDRACRIFIDIGGKLDGSSIRTEEMPVCDQYQIQGDLFSQAVKGEGEVPVPLEESFKNMAVIDAVFASARSGAWSALKP